MSKDLTNYSIKDIHKLIGVYIRAESRIYKIHNVTDSGNIVCYTTRGMIQWFSFKIAQDILRLYNNGRKDIRSGQFNFAYITISSEEEWLIDMI